MRMNFTMIGQVDNIETKENVFIIGVDEQQNLVAIETTADELTISPLKETLINFISGKNVSNFSIIGKTTDKNLLVQISEIVQELQNSCTNKPKEEIKYLSYEDILDKLLKGEIRNNTIFSSSDCKTRILFINNKFYSYENRNLLSLEDLKEVESFVELTM